MFKRRLHWKQTIKDRLVSFAKEMREKASLLPPGFEKDDLLRKASRADVIWTNGPTRPD
jgi:hypothetical protein